MLSPFLIILVVLAILSLEIKNLLSSVIVFGAFSLVLSLILYYLHAPDVAITEAAIGAGFATVIFIIAIKKKGTLIMLTYPHSRFFYYDKNRKPAGLDYDILSLFARKLNIELEVKVVENWQDLIPQLVAGKGDIIGAGMTRLQERMKKIDFSDGYFPTKVVLVTNTESTEINSIDDIKGKKVFSVPETSNFLTLKSIEGIEIDTTYFEPNKLLEIVSRGNARIAAVDLNDALVGQVLYRNIKIIEQISDIQEYGFGVTKNRTELLAQLNTFLKEIKNDGTYKKLYKKYIH
jgi:ABC-type amino acid transport substrate-binding protein